jgi:transcription initiation factor TFIIIB Brf1 subunit/transcription initiation factor TFIIB
MGGRKRPGPGDETMRCPEGGEHDFHADMIAGSLVSVCRKCGLINTRKVINPSDWGQGL